ncbi:hypothetical protein DIT71_08770 [Marinobacter vulgaris]|uniref:DUF2970 domain-containing protein n=1 Tax=Marinobacter vulgaris TaxID=1928331 RepID=A0A2V3ZLI8_9GAMM|nr:DUF2970 domain-containing protein [Marinobacter vulgaris]PXX91924.1 hypothetical protein DIT71_08770 [Marinobacter vulgaris]TSJ70563.1 DUF2970 domain-containing protein [Marinobacter vulgaris]
MAERQDNRRKPANSKKGPGVLKVMQSILAGALGVQSDKRREEDFSSHSPWPYIIAGILFTAGFVVTLIVVVKVVLSGQ